MIEESAEAEFTGWIPLQRHLLEANPHHDIFGTDNMRFTFLDEGEVMQVFVKHTRRDTGNSWILIGIRFHPANPAVTALLKDTGDPVGALCLIGDYLCFTHNLPLRGLSVGQVDRTIRTLCAGARRFRRVLTQPAEEGSQTISHFDD